TLPPSPAVIANYVGAVQVGNLLFASGNTAGPDGPRGKVGKELTVEQCYEAARQTGLRVLSTVRATLGSLDRVKRVVKVLGMVIVAGVMRDQVSVGHGLSRVVVVAVGQAIGKLCGCAVGMSGLPSNGCFEVEIILDV